MSNETSQTSNERQVIEVTLDDWIRGDIVPYHAVKNARKVVVQGVVVKDISDTKPLKGKAKEYWGLWRGR